MTIEPQFVKFTPMMKQYMGIKATCPDAILFYRMGDFYEMFFEDAEIAAEALDIVLTSRSKIDGKPVPMCGVPYRACQSYLARLVEQGYKVAICDQMEDPASVKGIVRREITRVVTPGTIVDEELLQANANNYILALNCHKERYGLACLDISTTVFMLTEVMWDELWQELYRLSPREIVLPRDIFAEPFLARLRDTVPYTTVSFAEPEIFEYAKAHKYLLNHLGTLSLGGFGCAEMPASIISAAAVLQYVSETQRQSIGHLRSLSVYYVNDYMTLDVCSRKNLEIKANLMTGTRKDSLLGVLDKTRTPMGARLLQAWLDNPLVRQEHIEERLDAISLALANPTQSEALRELLRGMHDLERLGGKLMLNRVNAKDLVKIKLSLQQLPAVWQLLSELKTEKKLLQEVTFEELMRPFGLLSPPFAEPPMQDVADLLERAIDEEAPITINDGDLIKSGFNIQLDELKSLSSDGKSFLLQLEVRERAATGINTLKVSYNRVFGYYIEIPRSRVEQAPEHYIRKQTLANNERYITEELKVFEEKVLNAEDDRKKLEFELFCEVKDAVTAKYDELARTADFIGLLDCVTSVAQVAREHNYCRPEFNTKGFIRVTEGRHPVVEQSVGRAFVPNTVYMDNAKSQVLIITGPNMAGKSTILRQLAIQVVMAQAGLFVPAQSANLCLVDRIFTRVSTMDNLSRGQSTFMVEMEETSNILNNATPDSLVIVDEVGRGTSTFDGFSIAWAVAEYLHDLKGQGVKTLFATHYHELTDLAKVKPRVKNFSVAVKEWNDEIIFLHKLAAGGTSKSYGIQVARLAGIPQDVVRRAKEILAQIEAKEDGGVKLDLSQMVHDAQTKLVVEPLLQVQPGLFAESENPAVRKLREADVNSMTPLQALGFLAELKELLQ